MSASWWHKCFPLSFLFDLQQIEHPKLKKKKKVSTQHTRTSAIIHLCSQTEWIGPQGGCRARKCQQRAWWRTASHPAVSQHDLSGRGAGGEGGRCSSAWPLGLQLEGPVSLSEERGRKGKENRQKESVSCCLTQEGKQTARRPLGTPLPIWRFPCRAVGIPTGPPSKCTTPPTLLPPFAYLFLASALPTLVVGQIRESKKLYYSATFWKTKGKLSTTNLLNC